jgi:hypothetical protein
MNCFGCIIGLRVGTVRNVLYSIGTGVFWVITCAIYDLGIVFGGDECLCLAGRLEDEGGRAAGARSVVV